MTAPIEIISRSEAKARGLTRYFTGEPCKHGHVCERMVKSTKCVACRLACERAYSRANPEKVREQKARWGRKNPDKVAEKNKKHYRKNINKMRAQAAARYARLAREDPDKLREVRRKSRQKPVIALAVLKRLGIQI